MRFAAFFFLFILVAGAFASEEKVAKIIILKGEAFEVSKNESRVLKKGDWVYQGRSLKTSNKSFLKLLFIDKSQMSLGPSSELKIKEFKRDKAGIVDLIKGKIRAKVTKNYMEIDKKKSKLFIKTKTAAMGVRGTDFQVLFNPENKVTSLLTFEGSVAMTKLNEQFKDVQINQRNLERRLNAPEAVMVRQGQYSGSIPGKSRVSIPVKISPTQLESLKDYSAAGSKEPNSKNDSSKKERSIIPPGMDAKMLAEVSKSSIDTALESSVGSDKLKKVESNTQSTIAMAKQGGPPPEGFENKSTGAHAPASGGFIDDQSGLYIPPPVGSAFDSNAGVYVPSPEVGRVDSETGSYIPPEGLKPIMKENRVAFTGTSSGRGPASVGDSVAFVPKSILDNKLAQQVDSKVDAVEIFRERQREIENANNNKNAILQTGRARVKFRISR